MTYCKISLSASKSSKSYVLSEEHATKPSVETTTFDASMQFKLPRKMYVVASSPATVGNAYNVAVWNVSKVYSPHGLAQLFSLLVHNLLGLTCCPYVNSSTSEGQLARSFLGSI